MLEVTNIAIIPDRQAPVFEPPAGAKNKVKDMEYYNDTLCITHAELTSDIMSVSMLNWYNHTNKIKRVRRGCNSTPALYAVNSLPHKYQQEVYRRNPDLKAQTEAKPFIEQIEPDGVAINFYESYSLGEGRYLPKEKVTEYCNNACILNAFRVMIEKSDSQHRKISKRTILKKGFWELAAGALPRMADKYPNSLPQNPRRLQEKYTQYRKDGYAVLISSKFGIKNAAIIDDETKESLLMQLIGDARNLDDAQIARLYNIIANAQEWKTITRSTVRVWRQKCELITSGARLGATRFRNQKTMQVKRSRPTLPMLYWTMDGWTAELLYQDTKQNKNGHNITTYTNRLTVVIVLDPCKNYPIGYAIGERETPELIKSALRNAANHTAELFGRRYRVNQLQSDNYGRGAVTPIYQVMGEKYTPAKAHNAKAKVIEPYFGQFNKKYCQMCKNWSGFGITSNRDLQPNSEFLNKNRHNFPDKDGCARQITAFIEAERSEKREEYVALFAQLPEENRLPLSDEQYLLTFGAETGYKNALDGAGLHPTIEGVKRDYDCFDIKFREHSHIKWSVRYDPNNLDKVLAVNEDNSLRFMLEAKYVQPMALAERKEGDAKQLERIHQFNDNLEEHNTQKYVAAYKRVEQLFNDNPQLDVATRLLLCDSGGQNKNNKSTRRLQAHEIEDIPFAEVSRAIPLEINDDNNIYDLY